ncbi:hypothetical protein PNOK_0565900 [Pyrrhoderma noxium]|uniref:Uncharacterized protein n=1 Tax=Pyrrhoderma noxium TaxID=2282107 RepID=A0A286UGR6_9AGAM|nr:hypothetical protein PNOK_0565900 [Pyrrhoderma noxium]
MSSQFSTPHYPPGVAECKAPLMKTVPLPKVQDYGPPHVNAQKDNKPRQLQGQYMSSNKVYSCTSCAYPQTVYHYRSTEGSRPLTPESGTDSEAEEDLEVVLVNGYLQLRPRGKTYRSSGPARMPP